MLKQYTSGGNIVSLLYGFWSIVVSKTFVYEGAANVPDKSQKHDHRDRQLTTHHQDTSLQGETQVNNGIIQQAKSG